MSAVSPIPFDWTAFRNNFVYMIEHSAFDRLTQAGAALAANPANKEASDKLAWEFRKFESHRCIELPYKLLLKDCINRRDIESIKKLEELVAKLHQMNQKTVNAKQQISFILSLKRKNPKIDKKVKEFVARSHLQNCVTLFTQKQCQQLFAMWAQSIQRDLKSVSTLSCSASSSTAASAAAASSSLTVDCSTLKLLAFRDDIERYDFQILSEQLDGYITNLNILFSKIRFDKTTFKVLLEAINKVRPEQIKQINTIIADYTRDFLDKPLEMLDEEEFKQFFNQLICQFQTDYKDLFEKGPWNTKDVHPTIIETHTAIEFPKMLSGLFRATTVTDVTKLLQSSPYKGFLNDNIIATIQLCLNGKNIKEFDRLQQMLNQMIGNKFPHVISVRDCHVIIWNWAKSSPFYEEVVSAIITAAKAKATAASNPTNVISRSIYASTSSSSTAASVVSKPIYAPAASSSTAATVCSTAAAQAVANATPSIAISALQNLTQLTSNNSATLIQHINVLWRQGYLLRSHAMLLLSCYAKNDVTALQHLHQMLQTRSGTISSDECKALFTRWAQQMPSSSSISNSDAASTASK